MDDMEAIQSETLVFSLNEKMVRAVKERALAKVQLGTDRAIATMLAMMSKMRLEELSKTQEAQWNKILRSVADGGGGRIEHRRVCLRGGKHWRCGEARSVRQAGGELWELQSSGACEFICVSYEPSKH
jgi:hypothetical protein